MGKRGHRCSARRFLEFDHIEPWALGGQATESGIRLLCRTHNQFEAERLFGVRFMAAKRHAARVRVAPTAKASIAAVSTVAAPTLTASTTGAAGAPPATASASVSAAPAAAPTTPLAAHDATAGIPGAANPHGPDVMSGLRNLGYRAAEARRAVAHASIPGATLEESMRAALRFLGPGRALRMSTVMTG